ncbi:MAG: nitrate reductase gamma subunit [Thermoanaerobacter sp.]|uniref:respiratory nitrate reductase subunit gamma n=1 Tax=Desulfofundulus thermocisternus TaxID=42471 RepID=UPI000486F4E4|nr:respiratory nitrate reductase subunit gamma [Desulfofundulus thermocisternus]MDK2888576.1 nitrate reductase gamma subunit [Thermoanaerobacter sp.]
MTYFIAQILPYITVTVFIIGVIYRLWRWAASRIVHNITLSPFPQTKTEVAAIYLREIVLFNNVFKFDRPLWVGAWPMHIALLNVIGGHVVGFYFLGKQFVYLGASEALSTYLSNLLGTVFGIILLAGLLYLLYRRIAIDKVRQVSNPSDYLMLLLLISIVSLGNFMRLVPEYGMHYEPVREYFTTLILFQPAAIPEGNPFFILHLLLAQILIMILPFSKLMHLFGMFGMRWIENRIYKEPAPGLPNVDVAAARARGTGLPSAGSTDVA